VIQNGMVYVVAMLEQFLLRALFVSLPHHPNNRASRTHRTWLYGRLPLQFSWDFGMERHKRLLTTLRKIASTIIKIMALFVKSF
jgi:hypothetical protein